MLLRESNIGGKKQPMGGEEITLQSPLLTKETSDLFIPGGKNVPRTVMAASETSVMFMIVSCRDSQKNKYNNND